MCTQAKLSGAPVDAGPPQKYGDGQQKASNQPPASLVERRNGQAKARWRWLKGQPEQLTNQLQRIPVHHGQHIEADDVEGQGAKHQRGQPQAAQVNRSDLCIAQPAGQVPEPGCADAFAVTLGQRNASRGRPGGLYRCKEILIFSHHVLLVASMAPDGHVQPPTPPFGPTTGPERAADHDAQRGEPHCCERQESPRRWIPSVPTE